MQPGEYVNYEKIRQYVERIVSLLQETREQKEEDKHEDTAKLIRGLQFEELYSLKIPPGLQALQVELYRLQDELDYFKVRKSPDDQHLRMLRVRMGVVHLCITKWLHRQLQTNFQLREAIGKKKFAPIIVSGWRIIFIDRSEGGLL